MPGTAVLNPPTGDSRTLVEAVQAGDMGAYAHIYRAHRDAVYRFILGRVGNRQLAEDLTQTTFLRGLTAIHAFCWDRPFVAYLMTIARNLVVDHARSGRARLEITVWDVLDTGLYLPALGGNPEESVVNASIDRDMYADLHNALTLLTQAQRACLTFRFLRGFSVANTAKAMGLNEGAVKSLQVRALAALARLAPYLHPGTRP